MLRLKYIYYDTMGDYREVKVNNLTERMGALAFEAAAADPRADEVTLFDEHGTLVDFARKEV